MARKSIIIDTFSGQEIRITQLYPWLCKLEIVDADGIEILARTELTRENMEDIEKIFRYGDFKIELEQVPPHSADQDHNIALSREDPLARPGLESTPRPNEVEVAGNETGDPFEEAEID